MSISKTEYKEMTQKASPPSPSAKNYPKAFAIGGLICCIGQGLFLLFNRVCDFNEERSNMLVSDSLIVVAALLTVLGFYNKIGKHGGAGTLVPITGFSNSVVSPAMEFRSEGFIFGVGARIFSISGPVIVYGLLASFIYGVIYYIFK